MVAAPLVMPDCWAGLLEPPLASGVSGAGGRAAPAIRDKIASMSERLSDCGYEKCCDAPP
jgi:hypothetical protein